MGVAKNCYGHWENIEAQYQKLCYMTLSSDTM